MADQPVTPRKPAQKRTYDPAETRRRILDVAAEAFQSRGYHATAMHDVMRDAGVTGGALYHHFPTKKALALAVVRERVAQEVEETWIEPIRSATTAAVGVMTVFHRIRTGLESRGAVSGCPLNNLALELSLADPEIRIAMQELFDRWRHAIEQKLRAEQEAGRSENLDPEAFATFVVAAYSGAMALAKAGQDTAPLAACARQLERAMQSTG